MQVTPVDERDALEEMVADGYRVMIVRPGRVVSAFDVDAASTVEALSWAETRSEGGGFSVAARFDQSGGGVTLMWLTPPPEAVMLRERLHR